MVAGKKDFNGESLPYLVLLMSLLRPELQGIIKQDQTVPAIPVGGGYNPYNLTGVAFNDYPYYGTSFNNNISPKEVPASNYEPLRQYLNWQPNATSQFDTSAVAMILGEATPGYRLPFDSESGYGSDEARSPLSAASYSRSSSPPYSTDSGFQGNVAGELSGELGATGFTPSSASSLDDLLNLEDFVDLESFPLMDPNKGTIESPEFGQFEFPNIKQEPGYTTNKMSPLHSNLPIGKIPDDEMSLTGPWELGMGADFNPYSIDFSTNQSLPFSGEPTGLESQINIDSLVDLDFPLDLLNPEGNADKPLYQQAPLTTGPNTGRNDSGFPLHGSSTLALSSNNDRSMVIPAPLNGAQSSQGKAVTSSSAVRGKRSTLATASKGKKYATVKQLHDAKAKHMDAGVSSFGLTDEEIAQLPVNEFTALLEKLTESQAQYARDVRRRGKNKEAARVCRKRKMDVIDILDDELMDLKEQKQRVLDERKELQSETAEFKRKISELESNVFSSLRDNNGRPLSSVEYSLFQGSDGAVFVGKNIAAKQDKKDKSS